MNNKNTITLIAIILAVVLSLLFLVVRPITTNFLLGYFFALFGIGGLWLCTSLGLERKGSYPWIAALPIAALTYLVIEALASVVVVVPAQLGIWILPAAWFFLLHAIILAIFAIRILMLLSGTRNIDARGEAVQQKVLFIRSMQVEVEMLATQATDDGLKKVLIGFAEKIRYSDPMSHSGLAALETKLEEKVVDLKLAVSKGETEQSSAIIRDADSLLEERNKKSKLLK